MNRILREAFAWLPAGLILIIWTNDDALGHGVAILVAGGIAGVAGLIGWLQIPPEIRLGLGLVNLLVGLAVAAMLFVLAVIVQAIGHIAGLKEVVFVGAVTSSAYFCFYMLCVCISFMGRSGHGRASVQSAAAKPFDTADAGA